MKLKMWFERTSFIEHRMQTLDYKRGKEKAKFYPMPSWDVYIQDSGELFFPIHILQKYSFQMFQFSCPSVRIRDTIHFCVLEWKASAFGWEEW